MAGASRKRHPIRGALSGLSLGLGTTLLAVSHSFVPFGKSTPLVLVVGFLILGLVFGLWGPGRARKRARGPAAALLGIAILLVMAAPAGAQTPGGATLAGGCVGTVTSSGEGGGAVGSIAPGSGPGASQNMPFIVEWKGGAHYEGSSPGAITDHKWHVDVFGIPVRSGGDPNEGGETMTVGDIAIKDFLPFRFTGLYFVSGEIKGKGPACEGSTWVKLAGNPIGTIPWDVGAGLTLLGVWGLVASAPEKVGAGPAKAAVPDAPAAFHEGGPMGMITSFVMGELPMALKDMEKDKLGKQLGELQKIKTEAEFEVWRMRLLSEGPNYFPSPEEMEPPQQGPTNDEVM